VISLQVRRTDSNQKIFCVKSELDFSWAGASACTGGCWGFRNGMCNYKWSWSGWWGITCRAFRHDSLLTSSSSSFHGLQGHLRSECVVWATKSYAAYLKTKGQSYTPTTDDIRRSKLTYQSWGMSGFLIYSNSNGLKKKRKKIATGGLWNNTKHAAARLWFF